MEIKETIMIRYGAIVLYALLIGLTGCEEEYIPVSPGEVDDLVVEGYIEAGESPLPTYVILTRAIPFFSDFGVDEFENLYVRGATVEFVVAGGQRYPLTQVCWEDLDPALKEVVAAQLGLSSGELPFNLCVYVDIAQAIEPEPGKRYDLEVRYEEKELRASTLIPHHVPLDSLWFLPPRGEPNDTMAELWCRITDPADEANYYRYLTGVNGGRLIAGFSTVTDDAFFDGQSFDFPLSKSEDPNEDVDPDLFGLFQRGDTVRLKWCNIDEEHYYFWSTLETSRTRQGPFSSYVRIASNVEGGLGIWGGYSVSYYDLVVPPN